MSTMCRTCGQESQYSRTLFDKDGTDILFDVLKLTGILLTNNPGAPTRICMSCQLDLKAAITFRELCIRTNKVWFQELDTADKETELEGSKEEDDINYNTTKKTEVLDPLLNEETIKVENQSLQLEAEPRDSCNQQLDGVTELSTKKPKKRGRPPKGQSESVVIRLPEKKSQKEATRRKWARARRIHAKGEGLLL